MVSSSDKLKFQLYYGYRVRTHLVPNQPHRLLLTVTNKPASSSCYDEAAIEAMEAIHGKLLLHKGPNHLRKLQPMQADVAIGFVEGRCFAAVVSEAVVLGSQPVVVGANQRGSGAVVRVGSARFSAERAASHNAEFLEQLLVGRRRVRDGAQGLHR